VNGVNALAIRAAARRRRRRMATLLAVAVVASAITAHHSGLPMAMHDGAGMGSVVEMCLGVFTAVGAALVAAGFAVLALGRWRPARMLPAPAPRRVAIAPVARARHGPFVVCVLCVSRR
jgi:hypothetical protein